MRPNEHTDDVTERNSAELARIERNATVVPKDENAPRRDPDASLGSRPDWPILIGPSIARIPVNVWFAHLFPIQVDGPLANGHGVAAYRDNTLNEELAANLGRPQHHDSPARRRRGFRTQNEAVGRISPDQ
jgi:hypothetical protein